MAREALGAAPRFTAATDQFQNVNSCKWFRSPFNSLGKVADVTSSDSVTVFVNLQRIKCDCRSAFVDDASVC